MPTDLSLIRGDVLPLSIDGATMWGKCEFKPPCSPTNSNRY